MVNYERHAGKLLVTCFILFILMLSFFIAFLVEKNKTKGSDEISPEKFTVCCTPDCQESAKFLNESINYSVNPCDDFYQYACGNWLQNNPIPDSEPQLGILHTIGQKINEKIKVLLNEPNRTTTEATDKAKILYKSCMQEDEKVEMNEINGLLAKLGGWPLISDTWIESGNWKWWEAVATAKNIIGMDVILGASVIPNFLNTSKYTLLLQLPLPDQLQFGFMSTPHLVLNATEKPDLITGYKQLLMKTVCQFNKSTSICNSASTMAEITKVVNLEVDLQTVAQQASLHNNAIPRGVVLGDTVFHSPNLRSDDQDIKSYIMKVKDLQAKINGVEWETFLGIILKDSQINSISELEVIALTPVLQQLINIVNTKYSKKTVANYIAWKVVQNLMPYGTASFTKIQFEYNSIFLGLKSQPKLADSCVTLAATTMGFAVTSLYASAHLGSADIEHAKNLITNIRGGFLYTLAENSWLDKPTKERAIKKLNTMGENVAFPIWNKNTTLVNEYYRNLPEFSEKEFFKNALSAMKGNFLNSFSKLQVPVDRMNDWPIKNPMTLNSFYYANLNSFYLVAGIMDLPILSKNSLESLNHGGIGYIIGHEIMHGFDTKGSFFDELGQLQDWWSQDSKDQFIRKATCMLNQYSIPLEQIPSLRINGQLTLGENIADNGGLKGSYWGYKAAVKEDIRLPGLESISGDKLFFISAAQLWCTNVRNEAAEMLLLTDNHSPAKYRVNIPFGNSEEFSKAFKCNKNAKMNIRNKCVIF